jgi:hypothetical protein
MSHHPPGIAGFYAGSRFDSFAYMMNAAIGRIQLYFLFKDKRVLIIFCLAYIPIRQATAI